MTTPRDSLQSIPELTPLDEYNRQLGQNVHPPDWVNPEPAGRYNMVVIGAGTAGLVTAAGTAGLGGKVALIERNLMGGDCLNVGCVPSKALIRAARAAADVRDAGNFGVRVPEGVVVDFAAVMERMRKLRAGISKHDSAQRFKDLGVDVFIGDAKFSGPNEVQVAGKKLVFSKACIASGARAVELPIPGLHEAGVLTNESVFSLTERPARLAVIGAGPIGVELAQAFARLGSKVTLLEQGHQILGREDRDAAELVRHSLERDGVEVECCARITAVRRQGGVRVLVLEHEGQTTEREFDQVLVGVGRQPNVETLNLEAAGVAFDPRKGVQVDDRLRTTNSNVFAAGDVCFPYKFTHTADAMARIVIQNALFFGRSGTSALNIPWCTYSDPEIAHVGLYEQDAKEKGIEVDTFRIEMSQVDRAILEGETEGFLKVHVKKGTDQILGATMVSRHAGESISEITLAMNAGAGLATIAKTIHPYPTQSEAIKKAADAYSRTRLTPTVKNIFDKLLAWRR
ncbi:MAG: mercuric reductase [Acidobacteria bacterium]|nr:mercuric reductase [Acidobacteriota bacterium]MDA1234359.1 mercuric reductase [Acidobacteriota bacterium]